MTRFVSALACILATSLPVVQAGTLHVPGTYATIQAAIDAAAAGDTVLIADGVYTGEGNKDLRLNGKAITVRSENGPANCIIDCERTTRGLGFYSHEGPDSVVDGLTIANGSSGNNGGGISCYQSSPTIVNCIIERCSAYLWGGGISCRSGSDVRIEDCTIRHNESGESGGGLYSSGSSPTVSNCLVYDNMTLYYGGGIYTQSNSPRIINCTIMGNRALHYSGGGSGGLYVSTPQSETILANCIVWDNEPRQMHVRSNELTVAFCDVQGGAAEVYLEGGGSLNWNASNIDLDPGFAFAGDWHLTAGSPCIDAGTNTPGGIPEVLPATDLDGNARPLDGDGDTQATADMGAYEFALSASSIAVSSQNIEFFIEEGAPPAQQTLSLRNAGGVALNWQVDESCDWLAAAPLAGSISTEKVDVTLEASAVGLLHGDYVCPITVFDPQATNSPRSVLATLHVNRALLVPSEYATIQAAIDAAVDGDLVLLANGRYTGTGNTELDYSGKAITLRSEDGPAECIIDGEDTAEGFYFHHGEGPNAVVDGITITRATYGIRSLRSSPTVTGCVITASDPAIHCWKGSPTIVDCAIENNTGYSISASTCEITINGCTVAHNQETLSSYNAAATITNCVIHHNSTTTEGGGLQLRGGRAIVANCVIANNRSEGNGGGIFTRNDDKLITNCTIVRNQADGEASGVYIERAHATAIENCIMQNESDTEIYLSFSAASVAFTNVEGGQGAVQAVSSTLDWGDGNIDADPSFALREDYHLMTGSPCIDAGTNTPGGDPAALPLTDIEGNTRPLDGDGDSVAVADMGAFELNVSAPTIAISDTNITFADACLGAPNPIAELLQIRNAGGGTLAWTATKNCTWLAVEPASGTSASEIDQIILRADITGLIADTYYCEVGISDPLAVNSPRTVTARLRIVPSRLVPSEYATIQAAIDAADEGDIVLVADGTYTGEGNKYIEFDGKAITVRSENGPAACILDCEGDGRAFYFYGGEGPDTIVSGFTIRNGASTNGGAFFCSGSRPTVRNCILRNCSATYAGGGVFCSGSNVSFTNCAIIDCAATVYGGGVYCYGSSPRLTNCTLTGGLADRGSGIYCFDSSPTITNTLIWGGDDQALYVSSGSPTVTYSNIQGGWPGSTNLDANPMLAGDGLHLAGGSPCIDAADPTGAYGGQTDLDGQPRRLYAVADIGADEFAWTADFDLDADVDLADFSLFQACFNGPNRPPTSAGCDAADFDADSDVDIADFSVFGGCFNGPNRTPRCP